VFPSGNYRSNGRSGVYGTNVNFPIPIDEGQNLKTPTDATKATLEGCIDRGASGAGAGGNRRRGRPPACDMRLVGVRRPRFHSAAMSEPDRPPVLVVDDNLDNTEIIARYLGARGYPVTVAHDGDEAMTLFEQTRPALVLLDVMMPGRDGWEVCRLMRQHPALGKRVRIIMVTALDEWDDKRQALQTGADDYVAKPFDLPKLAATVERNAALLAPA
jgi:CheY-like chemotaxis protein